MKKILRIIIIVLLAILLILGWFIHRNWNSIDAVIHSVGTTEEDTIQEITETKEKLQEFLEKEENITVRDLTEEESKALSEGKLTEEEIIELITGVTSEGNEEPKEGMISQPETNQEPRPTISGQPHETQVATQNPQSAVGNQVTKPGGTINPTKMPTSTKEPVSTKAPVSTKEPMSTKAPASTKEPASTKTPAPTKDPVSTKTPTATKEPTSTPEATPTPEPSSEEKVSKLIAKLYVQKSQYLNRLDTIEANVRAEYLNNKNAWGSKKAAKQALLKKYLPEVASWEKNCDSMVYGILDEIRAELKKSGKDESIVETMKKSYIEEKKLKKTYFINRYMD